MDSWWVWQKTKTDFIPQILRLLTGRTCLDTKLDGPYHEHAIHPGKRVPLDASNHKWQLAWRNDQKILTEGENNNKSWTDNIITATGTTFPDTKLHAGCCVRRKPDQMVSTKVGIIPICWLGATNGRHLTQVIVDVTKCKRDTLDSEEKSHQVKETCKEIFKVKCLVRFYSLRYLSGIQRVLHSWPLL